MPDRFQHLLDHLFGAWEPYILRILEFLPLAILAAFGRFVACWHGKQCHTWRGWLLEICVAVLTAQVVDAILLYIIDPLPMSLRIAAASVSGVSGMRLLYALSDRAFQMAKGEDVGK